MLQQNEELRAAQQALRGERTRYEALFDLAPDGYLVTDLHGLIEEANLTASRMLGVRDVSLVGKPLLSYIAEQDRGRFVERLAFYRGGGELGRDPWQLGLQPDRGSPFAASITVAPVRDVTGQVTGLRWMTRDVTPQVRAEEERARLVAELDAERALFRAIFESAPEGMVVADAEGRIVMTNPPAERLYARPVPYGEPYDSHAQLEICHPDGSPCDPRQLPLTRAALDGEVSDEVRLAIVWPDGQRRELLVNAAPIRGADDKITGAVSIFQDFTDWVQVEEEREWLLEENRTQRAFLERLIETAPVGIAVVRAPDYRYERVNARYRAIPGTPRTQMAGRTVAEVFPEVAAAGAIRFLEEACRSGRTVRLREYAALVGPAREDTYWNVDHVPLRDARGEIDAVLIVAQEVTEQVRHRREIEALAEAIGRERNLLDTVLENTPAHLAYLDPEFNFLMVNSTYAEGSGHRAEELVGRNHFELFPDAENQAIFEQVRDTGKGVSFQARPFEFADQPERGTTYWDWSLVPVLDAGDEVQGLVLSLMDVTAQEQARRALEGYADRLRTLHEADRAILDARSPREIAAAVLPYLRAMVPSVWAGVALYDGQGTGVSLLAVDPDVGAASLDVQHASLVDEGALAALQRGEVYLVDEVDAIPDPAPLTQAARLHGVHALLHVPLLAQGELIGALNVALSKGRSVSEGEMLVVREVADQLAIGIRQAHLQQQVEAYARELEDMVAARTEALRASEARFRAIYENAGIGIALADLEGRLVDCNAAFEDMLGYSVDALRGRHFRDLTHPEDLAADAALARELVTGQRQSYQLEKRYLRADGGIVWANLTVSLIADQEGEPRYAVGLVEDVTERKQAQEALIRSEKLAATGRLAASLAHEISNPLQSVLGCLGLAQEMADDDGLGQYIDIGMEEVERAARIVNRLRDVGRQADDASREPTDLQALLERIALLTRKQCQNQGIAFELSLPGQLPQIEAVPDHVQQVFLNLVLNAMDAMPEGGEIRVCAQATQDPTGIEITIGDSGNGIDPETLGNLFEPFVTTKPDGTGLGLYISRRIVEGHGGYISIESTVGEGTQVRIWLPA